MGCIVTSIDPKGRVGRDGHLAVGDVILAINGENLRNVTSAQARGIVRRLSLVDPTDVRYVVTVDYMSMCLCEHDELMG